MCVFSFSVGVARSSSGEVLTLCRAIFFFVLCEQGQERGPFFHCTWANFQDGILCCLRIISYRLRGKMVFDELILEDTSVTASCVCKRGSDRIL